MTANISHRFNIPNDWMATLKGSLTLKRHSKNTFTPNPENTIESRLKTATLKRFQKGEEISEGGGAFCLRNQAKTLERIGKESSKPLSSLEQARQCFGRPEQEGLNAESGSLLQVLSPKAQNEINRKLQLAKNSFQNGSYKDAKKRFEKILQKPLNQERTTIELYLATIYLLQDYPYKAKKHLEGKPTFFTKGDTISLEQVMYSHTSYLISKRETPEKIRGPCLIVQHYGKAEGFSEDKKIMAKALYKKFVSNS